MDSPAECARPCVCPCPPLRHMPALGASRPRPQPQPPCPGPSLYNSNSSSSSSWGWGAGEGCFQECQEKGRGGGEPGLLRDAVDPTELHPRPLPTRLRLGGLLLLGAGDGGSKGPQGQDRSRCQRAPPTQDGGPQGLWIASPRLLRWLTASKECADLGQTEHPGPHSDPSGAPGAEAAGGEMLQPGTAEQRCGGGGGRGGGGGGDGGPQGARGRLGRGREAGGGGDLQEGVRKEFQLPQPQAVVLKASRGRPGGGGRAGGREALAGAAEEQRRRGGGSSRCASPPSPALGLTDSCRTPDARLAFLPACSPRGHVLRLLQPAGRGPTPSGVDAMGESEQSPSPTPFTPRMAQLAIYAHSRRPRRGRLPLGCTAPRPPWTLWTDACWVRGASCSHHLALHHRRGCCTLYDLQHFTLLVFNVKCLRVRLACCNIT